MRRRLDVSSVSKGLPRLRVDQPVDLLLLGVVGKGLERDWLGVPTLFLVGLLPVSSYVKKQLM